MFSMMLASLSLRVVFHQFGSTSKTARRRLIVWISRSTMPVRSGLRLEPISFLKFLFLQNVSNSLALNTWTWSHLINLGKLFTLHWLSRFSIAVFVSLLLYVSSCWVSR